MLNEFVTLVAEVFRDKKKVPPDPETVNILLTKVFSKYHFPVSDSVETDKLVEFLTYLDSAGLSGELLSLYNQAQTIINLKSGLRQRSEYKNFVKPYIATNRQLCRDIGLRLPDGPKTFDDFFTAFILFILGSMCIFIGGIVVLVALNWPRDKWISLVENAIASAFVFAGFFGILLGAFFLIFTLLLKLIHLVKYYRQHRKNLNKLS